MVSKLAPQAGLWYNVALKMIVSGDARNTPDRIRRTRRHIMDTLPPHDQNYNLNLPEASGIYRITCTTNGKIYIGSAVNLRKRHYEHFRTLRQEKHRNILLQRAFNKYGIEAFTVDILELVLIPEMLTAREQYWFDKLQPFKKKGFNIAREAGSQLGIKHSPESIEKVRLTNLGNTYNLGKKRSPETIERLRRSHIGKPSNWRGKSHTPEAREKLRQANLGKKKAPYPFKPNTYRVEGDVSYIYLTKGQEAIIDTCDLEQVLKGKWHATYDKRTGNYRVNGTFQGERVSLNRYIIGAKEGEWADNINLNMLDNRRENLHLRDKPNRMIALKTSQTGIRGVGSCLSHGRLVYRFVCQCATCKIAKDFPYTEEGLQSAKIFAEAHYAAMK